MSCITRQYPADEITSNPVYLLEHRRVIPTDNGLRWDSDAECLMDGDTVADDEYLLSHEMAVETWEVYYSSGVWFTRDEAEAWADAHDYRVDGRHNFRVFCCCAAGELATLLHEHTKGGGG